ncbi:hypothetical protein B0J17DRAFT_770237 [Rhizoctonia solani]|nr:hypothetical protein B0J17DRAFT_770237 [Rhizoctonia solani]
MARFSALSMLVTLLCFLFWATRVSTPSHSDMSLRTIEIVPLVFPVLTISAPPPVRSPCAGINRCDKSPVYSIWASRVVGSVNQARNCLTARNLIRPYLLQVGRYAHQVMHMLGRPTPDSLVGLVVLPTTGKLAAPPLEWARAEKGPVAHALPPPPPPPPTRTLPVYVPPAPTSGPWNPPTPTTGHARLRSVEPVVKIDSNDWFQHTVFIGLTLVLAAASFVLHFKVALSSVDCAEHRDTESDEVAVYCDDIRSVVPPMTKSSALQTFRKSNTKSTLRNQQDRLELSLVTLLTADREPVLDEMARQTLDLVIWRAPILILVQTVPLTPSLLIGVSARYSLRQLSVVSRPPLRLDNIFTRSSQATCFPISPMQSRWSLLIECYNNTIESRLGVATPLSAAIASTNVSATLRHKISTGFIHIFDFPAQSWSEGHRQQKSCSVTPLLIQWYPTQGNSVARRPEIARPSTFLNTMCTPTLTLVSYIPATIIPTHALYPLISPFPFNLISRRLTPQCPGVLASSTFDQEVTLARRTQLLIEWRPKPRVDIISPSVEEVADPSSLVNSLSTTNHSYTTSLIRQSYRYNEVEIDLDPLEPTTSTLASTLRSDPPLQQKPPPRVPASFYRYASIRLEDLDGYPPEQRDEILRREIRVAEDRYRQEKSRRYCARFDSKWKRAEIEQKGGRPLARRKCTEELEEEEGLKKVMQARQRGEEEVFEGVGGPPRPVPEWLQALVEVVCDWGSSARMKKRMEDGMPKGILKRSASDEEGKAKGKRKGKGKKSKVVRWVDELGRRLAR